jgi:hypothetical protein
MIKRPNIFSLATKELSQDSYFTWLLQWADNYNSQHNEQLNETAKDFVRLLIGKDADYQIIKSNAGRQWNNIDIWAEINDEYFVVIEDKTNTCEHSEQLERYKQIATKHYKDKNHKLIFVYLKTGNESSSTLEKVIKKDYKIINRKTVLNVFNQRQVQNEIFNDFKVYLMDIENQTNSFLKFENVISNWKAAEGFYIKLQELLNEWSDWHYVPNQNHGFLGFWYHWVRTTEFNLNIQIENSFHNGIRVVIKIGAWTPDIKKLYNILSDLRPYFKKYGLTIIKPDKYKPGTTSTLAIVQNAISVENNGDINLDKTIKTLRSLEQVLDEYSNDKVTSNKTVYEKKDS